MFIIDDDTDVETITDGWRGLVERDLEKFPVGSIPGTVSAEDVDFPLIAESDWEAIIKEGVEQESFLDDIRNRGDNGKPIPSLNQGSFNYCWAFSPTSALTLLRARDDMPYVPLSGTAVGASIKNYRNEGGWSPEALAFIASKGVPSQQFWPQGKAHPSLSTKECWKNAEGHKVTEAWVDLTAPVYRRNLTFQQIMTLLLCRIPVTLDLAWWSHSVCGMAPVLVEMGSYGIRIWNSWSDDWGENGTAVLRGDKAIPFGACAPRLTGISFS